MGESLIIRRTKPSYKLPVLDSSLPADATFISAASGTVTLKTSIVTQGVPTNYSYQWYKNGVAINGATSASYKISRSLAAGTYNYNCIISSKAGEISSRYAIITVKSPYPIYTFNGTHKLTKEDDYNWNIKITAAPSGAILKFTELGNGANGNLQVFCVGGGGGGGTNFGNGGGAGGGGGGKTKTQTVSASINTNYTIALGGGGSSDGSGGSTSAFGISAGGGSPGTTSAGGAGGSGGGGGGGNDKASGAGGKNGNNGEDGDKGDHKGGKGQGTTTYEFGDSTRTLYAGGGGGCGRYGSSAGAGGSGGGGKGATACGYGATSTGTAGTNNTGGGGGGGNGDHTGSSTTKKGGKGGSGVIIIRNVR